MVTLSQDRQIIKILMVMALGMESLNFFVIILGLDGQIITMMSFRIVTTIFTTVMGIVLEQHF